MRESEKGPVVLVAAKEDLLNDLKDALSNTNFLLLHAPTKQEAIALLERLRTEISIAVVELEMPDSGGWDLIRQLTFLPNKPLKIIATTSVYPEPFFGKIKEIGVDAVVAKAIPPEAWLKTVEAVLGKNENTLPVHCSHVGFVSNATSNRFWRIAESSVIRTHVTGDGRDEIRG